MLDFAEIYGTVSTRVTQGVPINEVFDDPELERYRQFVASTPTMKPQPMDLNVEGWVARLELWGKLKVEHHDPVNKRKRKLSTRQFISKLTDQSLNKMFGLWDTEEKGNFKLIVHRKFSAIRGKPFTEKFVLTIDPKPELKKLMRRRIF